MDSKFGQSQPGGWIEDRRFLTGQGRYVDDIAPCDALHALFLRSPVAHGRVAALDVAAARAAEGVHLVLTAGDLRAAGVTLATVQAMLAAFTPFLAERLGVDPADLAFDGETFRAPGSNLTPTLCEAAVMARAAGRTDLLRHRAEYRLPGRSYPNGAHVAAVEIAPETGRTELVKYTVTDDFGTLIAPQLVEGQVHGGIAPGLGQVLCVAG